MKIVFGNFGITALYLIFMCESYEVKPVFVFVPNEWVVLDHLANMQEHHLLQLLSGIIPWIDPPHAVSQAIECGKSERLYSCKWPFLSSFYVPCSYNFFEASHILWFFQWDAWWLPGIIIYGNCDYSHCVWPTLEICKVGDNFSW